MIVAMSLAGALVGGGLLLVVRGLWTTSTPLGLLVDELHRPRQLRRVRRSPVDAFAERLAGQSARNRATDLAICERSMGKFVQDRLTWAMLLSTPGMAVTILVWGGLVDIVTPVVAVFLAVSGAAVGWLWALYDLRSDARTSRRDFRHALASYLELVTILMAGGAGVETALYDAAEIGRGPAFRHLQTALSAAQARREPPWESLGALGDRLAVAELVELDASMTLAGDGARVRDSLVAKADAMRNKDLSQLEAEAQSRSETMVLPVAMMFAGFLLLIGYPALAGLSGL